MKISIISKIMGSNRKGSNQIKRNFVTETETTNIKAKLKKNAVIDIAY